MSIARINHFHAVPGLGPQLAERLAGIVTDIAGSAGCRSVRLLTSSDDSNHLVIVEVWDSLADHRAAAEVIPPDLIASTVAMLEHPPSGTYFDVAASLEGPVDP